MEFEKSRGDNVVSIRLSLRTLNRRQSQHGQDVSTADIALNEVRGNEDAPSVLVELTQGYLGGKQAAKSAF